MDFQAVHVLGPRMHMLTSPNALVPRLHPSPASQFLELLKRKVLITSLLQADSGCLGTTSELLASAAFTSQLHVPSQAPPRVRS